jgi:hypothetical protein
LILADITPPLSSAVSFQNNIFSQASRHARLADSDTDVFSQPPPRRQNAEGFSYAVSAGIPIDDIATTD